MKTILITEQEIRNLVVSTMREAAKSPLQYMDVEGFDAITCARISIELGKVADTLASKVIE